MSVTAGRTWRSLGLVRRTLRRRKLALLRLLVWSAVETIPAFLSGRLVQLAVDRGFLQHQLLIGFGWLALFAVSIVVGGVAAGRVFRGLGAVVEPMRDDLARLVVEGSVRRAARLGLPVDRAAVARLTEQVEITREACASVLMVSQGFVVATIGAVAGLVTLIPAALLLVLPPVALGLVIFGAALPRIADHQMASILADERAADSASAVGAGMRDVTACGAEGQAARLIERHIDAQARATRQLARLTAVRTLAVATGGLVPALLILVAGSWLRSKGATTGVILGALTYVLQGMQPALQQLMRNLGSSGVWLVSALSRIVEASAAPAVEDAVTEPAFEDAGAPESAGPLEHAHLHDAAVHIKGLTFAYAPDAAPVIRGLDLTIPPGDHLAIIGPSGAGKSTLAALIAGLLRPHTGTVRIGSVDAHDVRRSHPALRALIPQEAYIFSGTLLENVTYLNPDASRDLVEHATASLGATALVERAGGYEGTVDPSTLSAGERQMITLVRAFVSTAPLIVLDEATCHLDAEAEAQAEHAFTERTGSLVVIAHRMSSALRAKRIMLLDGGDAVIGTHDALLEWSALYRSLVGHWTGARPHGARTSTNPAAVKSPSNASASRMRR